MKLKFLTLLFFMNLYSQEVVLPEENVSVLSSKATKGSLTEASFILQNKKFLLDQLMAKLQKELDIEDSENKKRIEEKAFFSKFFADKQRKVDEIFLQDSDLTTNLKRRLELAEHEIAKISQELFINNFEDNKYNLINIFNIDFIKQISLFVQEIQACIDAIIKSNEYSQDDISKCVEKSNLKSDIVLLQEEILNLISEIDKSKFILQHKRSQIIKQKQKVVEIKQDSSVDILDQEMLLKLLKQEGRKIKQEMREKQAKLESLLNNLIKLNKEYSTQENIEPNLNKISWFFEKLKSSGHLA